jgi:hypothetical protein
MEALAPDKQVTVIDKSIEVFKEGSGILLKHQARASKALLVADAIIKQWEAAYAIQDPDKKREALAAVDQRSNDFLANCGLAKVQMEDSRKAITQLMDMIKKMFTEEESKLDPKKDTKPAVIQSKRNDYARLQLEEQERIRREAEVKAAKAKESVEIKSTIRNNVTQRLLDFLAAKKIAITNSFNAITLEDFDEKSQRLKLMNCSFPLDKLTEIISSGVKPFYSKHSQEEVKLMVQTEIDVFDFPSFYYEYEKQLTEVKSSLIDKLPSKKEELEAMARADANEKIRLENERLNREALEKKRLEEEAARNKETAEKLEEISKASGTAQVLFDEVAESSIVNPAPEARTGFEIKINHPTGWVEIFQLWFQHEGCKMSPDDMGKKSLNQMKTFAEGLAKKEDVKIESKYLVYETAIKSVNRKPGK